MNNDLIINRDRNISNDDMIANRDARFGFSLEFETETGTRTVPMPSEKARAAMVARHPAHAVEMARRDYSRGVATSKGEAAHVALLEAIFSE